MLVTLGLGPGVPSETSEVPKVDRRGSKRSFGACGRKACCTGAREGGTGAKQGCSGGRHSRETITPAGQNTFCTFS